MKNINKLNCRQVMYYLNIIAEKEQEKAAVIVEKDEVIAYYRRAAELATRSKRQNGGCTFRRGTQLNDG